MQIGVSSYPFTVSKNRALVPPQYRELNAAWLAARTSSRADATDPFSVQTWCRSRDSNPNGVNRGILSPLRIPVPPLRLETILAQRFGDDFAQSAEAAEDVVTQVDP